MNHPIASWLRKNSPKRLVIAFLLLGLVIIFLNKTLVPPPNQALGAGRDLRGLFIPWFSFARNAIRDGYLPLWDASQFSGYPFLSNPQVALFYPPTWLVVVLPIRIGVSLFIALHIWLAALGMLLFIRSMGGGWLSATLSALAFGFSGFMAARIEAGHIGLLATNSWLPWLLLATAWCNRRNSAWAGVLGGVPLGLAILSGHTTSMIYIGMAWLGFALYLAFTTHRWRLVGRQFLLAVLTGLAISAVQSLALVQLGQFSSRASEASFEFASAFSLPPAHLITLLAPEFFGEPTRAGYWSVPNFAELTYYSGVLPLIGVPLALRKPSRLAWFHAGLMIFSLLLAFGSYGFLFPLLYKLLPPFQLARAPARATVLFLFSSCALLGEALSIWRRQSEEDRRVILEPMLRWLFMASAVSGTAALAATGAVFAVQHPSATSGRLWHQLGGWTMALIFTLTGLALLRAYFRYPRRRRLLGSGLLLLLTIDLWSFGFKLVRLSPTDPVPMWQDAKRIIGDDEARVLPWGISIFEQNGAGRVGLASVFGYNALEVGANTAFAASVPDPRSTALDILGAGYVLAQQPLEQYGDGERPLRLIGQTDHVWVYERGRTLPIARLAYETEIVEDAASATARIHEPGFDPTLTVILDRPNQCDLPADPVSSGTAKIVERRDGYWRIETDSPTPALMVLSETAYPGWKATISGEEVDTYTAYTTIRAVCVPAGEQEVVWNYKPTIYMVGGAVSVLALILVGTAVVGLRREERRRKMKAWN